MLGLNTTIYEKDENVDMKVIFKTVEKALKKQFHEAEIIKASSAKELEGEND
jgi:hypothetical protein